MTDLHVVGILKAKEGSEDFVRSALGALVAPTREEEGCISYDLYSSNAEPGTFITIELWRSQPDLDGHMNTAHVQEALSAAGDHLAEAPGIHPLSVVDA
jgi:quinol monooxygenase YgiN